MRREGTVISCPGRRVELIPWLRNRATALVIDRTVIPVDVNPHMSAACQVADGAVRVPPCDRPDHTVTGLAEVRVAGWMN